MILDYYLPNQLFYCKFVYEMSPPKFRIDTSALFVVKCDVQWLCVWFKCENSATWFWSNSWPETDFLYQKPYNFFLSSKTRPFYYSRQLPKEAKLAKWFYWSGTQWVEKNSNVHSYFLFLVFSRNDLLEDYAIWPIFIVTFWDLVTMSKV